jgi:hypothetical protein
MQKVLPTRYQGTGFNTKGTSLINNYSTVTISGRDPSGDRQRIVKKLKTEKPHLVTQKTPAPAAIQYTKLFNIRDGALRQLKKRVDNS